MNLLYFGLYAQCSFLLRMIIDCDFPFLSDPAPAPHPHKHHHLSNTRMPCTHTSTSADKLIKLRIPPKQPIQFHPKSKVPSNNNTISKASKSFPSFINKYMLNTQASSRLIGLILTLALAFCCFFFPGQTTLVLMRSEDTIPQPGQGTPYFVAGRKESILLLGMTFQSTLNVSDVQLTAVGITLDKYLRSILTVASPTWLPGVSTRARVIK